MITGLGGTDTVNALAGPDDVRIRDNGSDTADCGTEGDLVTTDAPGVDTLLGCESQDFLGNPETTITAGPADGSTTTSSTVVFGFTSNEPGSTFQCSLDAAAFYGLRLAAVGRPALRRIPHLPGPGARPGRASRSHRRGSQASL